MFSKFSGSGTFNYNIIHSGNYSSYALPLSGGSLSGNLTGTRIWLNHNSNLSTSYSWTNSALTVPTLEIQNYTGVTESMYPTITLHHYGYGGPRIGSRQGVLYIYGGDTDARGLGSKNGYFSEMRIYPNNTRGLYVNDEQVITSGNISSQSVSYASSAGTISGNFVFTNSDVPENSGNLASYATTNSIQFYRNGILVPYQMSNTNDGGMFRVTGKSEDSVICELATWDDSGAGETIQFNYYPTTSTITPTYSVSVPKKSGTIALTSDIPSTISWSNVTGKPFNWSGQSGQPTWLWGSNDGTNYYVWNPSNFNVNSASTATALKQYFCTDSGNWNANNLSTVCAWYYGQSGGVSNHCGSYGGVFTIHNGSLNNSLSMQLGWDIIHNTSPGTGGLWFKGKNDLGWQQWKRVLDNTYYYVDSDRHLKKNISTIPASSLEHLFDISDKLLKKFTWKQTGKDSYGFIAQELEWYISEAVGFDKNNNIKTVDYNVAFTKLFAALIYKIKELEKKVNSSNH